MDGAASVVSVTVAEAEAGERIDRLLAQRIPDLSRARAKALIEDGRAQVAGATISDPNHRVNTGEVITLALPPPVPALPAPEPIPLAIVYEDAHVIVIDKPAGLVVHPGPGNWRGTLVNALLAHCGSSLSGIGGVERPGIVHRLDKDTSGLLVVAKTDRAHRALAAQFADHGRSGPLTRAYLAFAWGAPERPRGTVDAPIERHPHAREKMAVRKGGREAVTHWRVVETYAGEKRPLASLLECRLETGRTHQIRVHLAHAGWPLLGDDVYGPGFRTKVAQLPAEAAALVSGLGRQALHAYLLGFAHPASGQYVEFRSELPADLARLRNALARRSGDGGSGTGAKS